MCKPRAKHGYRISDVVELFTWHVEYTVSSDS